MKKNVLVCSMALSLFAAAGSAQVVLNEIWANPAGGGSSGDDRWEFIELYGTPGMKLDGFMIATVFGGADDGNDIPGPLPAGWDQGDELPEIDEAWTLDGLTIGSNGFLVLYNNNGNNSLLAPLLPAATNRATFASKHIPTSDVAGRIKNDGSATFVLLRKRPFHTLVSNGSGGFVSQYDGNAGYVAGTRYGWRKDVNPDVNYDGKIDLNGVGTTGGNPNVPEIPVNSEDNSYAVIPTPPAMTLEPYQMIDDVAWSNGGGKEYVRSQDQEISGTSGFNPDAVSRVAYYGTNPNLGDRLNSSNVVVATNSADEEFIYGDILVNSARAYDTLNSAGPTIPGQVAGSRFNRRSGGGFLVTPGAFNDGTTTGAGAGAISQFRFVKGDFNFDGVVNCADRELLVARQGATLDDTIVFVNDRGTPQIIDDIVIPGWWKWQGRAFNGVAAMLNLNTTDGSGGTNSASVTAADLAAFDALFPSICPASCPADLTGDTFVDDSDFVLFASAYNILDCTDPSMPAGCPADLNNDQFVDDADFVIFAAAYNELLCP
ncbi:MAG: hypothetical protein K2Y21_11225 [Phycisphaerales bacterium]|nr:hypothetical protein [Phycisphaerales bacterium]